MSIVAGCLWVVLAQVLSMFPSRDYHWRAAYGLMALAVPVVAWLWVSQGWGAVAVFALAAGSILRWPLRCGVRWMTGGRIG
ncbi:DUF2484 family protein [Stagnihabitans tardus]|uniref:DUF2484 family protein n=1 Tax=Stagnihabitans tardus TaxID=2699202 RepID=A0AAE5BTS8_9RHOB|nr:DUF2484 family protein [Stagnihabitans tardus]NBZ87036.1 DUF2484 family protein [Stagnihabitans tardus]